MGCKWYAHGQQRSRERVRERERESLLLDTYTSLLGLDLVADWTELNCPMAKVSSSVGSKETESMVVCYPTPVYQFSGTISTCTFVLSGLFIWHYPSIYLSNCDCCCCCCCCCCCWIEKKKSPSTTSVAASYYLCLVCTGIGNEEENERCKGKKVLIPCNDYYVRIASLVSPSISDIKRYPFI